jgi:DNA primase
VLNEIKGELLKNQDAIVDLLEYFDFTHIRTSAREIRFARDERGGQNISIRLENNENIFVNDFARGISKDIFSYIIQEKSVTFRDVIQKTKSLLNLSNDWRPQQRNVLFGDIYNNISRKNRDIVPKVYDDSILNRYEKRGNLRFLRDGIGLKAQQFWDIRFSVMDDSIIIPIRNEFGELVGAKARINRDPEEHESKYYYPINFPSSQVLYGYSENYQYLYGNDVILVESEKSVCQGWEFNARNIVALGSNSLSEKQVKLLLQLNPKRIVIAMDEGLDFEQTKRNADMIKNSCTLFSTEIWYWDSTMDLDIEPKSSPTDTGKEKFEEIMREQLVRLY